MSDDGFLAGFLIFLVCGGFICGLALGKDNGTKIKSGHRIEPTLSIQIENGVADTTYIYKLK